MKNYEKKIILDSLQIIIKENTFCRAAEQISIGFDKDALTL